MDTAVLKNALEKSKKSLVDVHCQRYTTILRDIEIGIVMLC